MSDTDNNGGQAPQADPQDGAMPAINILASM